MSLAAGRPLETALDQAMLLGSADILLEELLALLTPRQAAIAGPGRRLLRADEPRRPSFTSP